MPRPKQFEPEEALNRAVRAFWRWGYHAASMDMLVKEMKVSRQSLYDTFGDKKNLFQKAMERYEFAVIGRELNPLSRTENAMDGLSKVLAGWASLARSVQDEPAGCLLTNSLCELLGTETELHQDCREMDERIEFQLKKAIEKASEAGLLPHNTDTSGLGGQLLYMRHGLMVARRAGAGDQLFKKAGYELQSLLQ